MAYVFARYATQFYNLGEHSKLIYALAGIIALTFINAIGAPGTLGAKRPDDRTSLD